MQNGRYIALVALLFAGCSAPTDDDNNVAPPNAVVDVAQGLYADEDAEAALAVWADGERLAGTLAVSQSQGFRITIADDATLTPLVGACETCTDASWDLDISRVGSVLSLVVAAHDGPGPGFDVLRMVPHDGFKPEFSPAPGVDVWAGHILAVSADVSATPVLDQDCEISIDKQTADIVSFDCFGVDSDSGWTDELPGSWADDGSSVSFEANVASYEGEVTADRFTGRVRVSDVVVGAFDFLSLTP